jgi:hypothetical protein
MILKDSPFLLEKPDSYSEWNSHFHLKDIQEIPKTDSLENGTMKFLMTVVSEHSQLKKEEMKLKEEHQFPNKIKNCYFCQKKIQIMT